MPGQVAEECRQKMDSTISVLQKEVAGIRTGRASTSLLEAVKVDYYGTPTPVTQVATVGTTDARTITIAPWDASQMEVIEKAIIDSDLGITPANDGKVIRLALPPMTEERRKELAKLVKKIGEDSKIAIRNVRRDGNEKVKKQLKNKEISEDEEKGFEGQIQKITDDHIAKVDSVVGNKEKEIMEK